MLRTVSLMIKLLITDLKFFRGSGLFQKRISFSLVSNMTLATTTLAVAAVGAYVAGAGC